jgi:hypothetical protein
MVRFWIPALATLSAVALAAPALADNEQVNLFAISCLPDAPCNSNTGSGGLALESYAYGSAYGINGGIVSARAGFSPSSATLGGMFLNNGSADYSYTFQVKGAAGVSVPVHISASAFVTAILASTFNGGQLTLQPDGTASGTTGFSIQSGVSIDINGIRSIDAFGNIYTTGAHVDAGNNSDNLDLGAKNVFINQTLYFESNTDISVNLYAGASLKFYDDGGRSSIYGSVSASADPTFTIDDPAFSSAFQIVGVPNDPAPPITGEVPEPATWAMMIGFGLTGQIMRRRKLVLA